VAGPAQPRAQSGPLPLPPATILIQSRLSQLPYLPLPVAPIF
jgi:hypothetical protein